MGRGLWALLALTLALLLLVLPLAFGRPFWEYGGRRATDVLPAALALPSPVTPGTPLRLGVLGTSLSARYDWPEVLAVNLQTCLLRPVVLTRIARPGATSRWGSEQIGNLLAAAPDIVLVEFATNDADLRDGLSRKASRAAHRAILDAVQAQRPDTSVVFLGMNPAAGLRGLLRPGLSLYTADSARLAADPRTQAKAGFVDLGPAWRGVLRDNAVASILPDGLHPTTESARKIIVSTLLAKIPWAAGTKCPLYS